MNTTTVVEANQPEIISAVAEMSAPGLQDGEYVGEIVSAYLNVTSPTRVGVDFEFRVIGGPHVDKRAWRTLWLDNDDPDRARGDRGPWYVYGCVAQTFANNPRRPIDSQAGFSGNFKPARPGLIATKNTEVVSCRPCDPATFTF
jgi:hypothetical protein